MAQAWIHGNLALILVKSESTYGSDPTPTVGANALYVRDFSLKKVVEFKKLKRFGPSFSSRGDVPAQRWCEFSFDVPLSGAPDPGGGNLADPDWAPLLKAAGMAVTASGGPPTTTNTWAPDSGAAQDSVTIYYYQFQDGGAVQLHKITGAVCNAKFDLRANDICSVKFEGKGLYTAETNPSAPSAPTYVDPSDAVVIGGATATVGGRSDIWTAMELDLGMNVVMRGNVNGTGGVAGFMRTRDPDAGVRGSYDPEKVLLSTYDRWADIIAGTTGALSVQFDSVGGTRWTFSAPAFQPLSAEEMREAVVKYKQPFVLQQSTDAGDDEIGIVQIRTP